jgi:hypothetical protein
MNWGAALLSGPPGGVIRLPRGNHAAASGELCSSHQGGHPGPRQSYPAGRAGPGRPGLARYARLPRSRHRGSAKLTRVTRASRNTVSAAAENSYLADVALAATFDELLAEAREAEQDFRRAQASGTPAGEQYPLATRLDAALTAAMKAAYAAERAEIGPRGYEDRIYRRKAKAKSAVHALTDEAERLLTLRESYRLTGFPARPEAPALGVEIAHLPSH